MAEITKRRRGELVRGVFAILAKSPDDAMPAREVLAELATTVPPTTFEKTYYEAAPSVRRYEKIVRFSSITAVKAGWLVKEKGQWSLTEEGRTAFDAYQDPETFEDEARRLYREWKKTQPVEEIDSDDETGVEPSTTLEEAEEAAWQDIRLYLAAMPPYEFQELVAALLRAIGYRVDWVSPPGQDQGVDVLAYTDALGAVGPRIKVQVKRQSASKMSSEDIRAFLAVLGEQDVGLYVSTGGFTSSAEREARAQEKRRLILIDATRLVELWVEHYSELADEDRRRLPLRPIYFLAPAD